jgi:hypothetical protein
MGGKMKSICRAAAFSGVAAVYLITAATTQACSYALENTIQITHAGKLARTTRSNGQCIAVDRNSRVHLVWEDDRHMNREVYYASVLDGEVQPQIRITSTPAESSFPCVETDTVDTYVLWEEVIGPYSDIMYARIRHGQVAVKKRLTRTYLDSSCPVSALGPDGALHIAWHEGPHKQSAIYYGRVESDSLVETYGVCTNDPEAFRPDIACDGDGRIMVIWPEGDRMASRLCTGSAWEEIQKISDLDFIPWRMSVVSLPDGKWAAAWFDGQTSSSEVYVSFHDEGSWQERSILAGYRGATSYYPDLAVTESGNLVAVWENRVFGDNVYTVQIRCHDGKAWDAPTEMYRDKMPGRYVSMVSVDGVLHAVWFNAKLYANEIYYTTLRSDE